MEVKSNDDSKADVSVENKPQSKHESKTDDSVTVTKASEIPKPKKKLKKVSQSNIPSNPHSAAPIREKPKQQSFLPMGQGAIFLDSTKMIQN